MSELQVALGADGTLVGATGRDDRAEVFFYYSGHSDAEGLLLGEEHLGYPELKAALDTVSADVRVAILDSCASGALIRAKGGTRIAPFLADRSNEVGGFAYITSSSADEVSQEADQIGGSYFTHALATGLRGAADQSGDGRVTLDEAYSFAYTTTLARTERSQFGPQHANHSFQLSGKGNLVLTDLHLTSASLVLDEELSGRALVRDEDGDLVAELIKPAGRMIELGLGAGGYEITFGKASDGRFAVAQVQLEVGTTAIVGADDLVWFEAETEASVARGDVPETPPTPPPPTATVVATEPLIGRPHPPRFELVPGFPPPSRPGVDSMILGVLTHSEGIKGLGLAFAGSLVDRDLEGTNFALGTSIVGGNLQGTQGTLGFNYVGGDARGAQLTLGANVVNGDMRGTQLSLGGNWARGFSRGVQTTLGLNSADQGFRGIQAALGGNISGRAARGFQLSLGANVAAGRVDGFQGTLGGNVAGDVQGFQGSLGVNVAGDVQGFQGSLGVNVAR
ncbi:MAG: caspase family protein, partial [Myxococcota bacterium]